MASSKPDATIRVRCDCNDSGHFIEIDHYKWPERTPDGKPTGADIWDDELFVNLAVSQAHTRWKRLRHLWKYFWSGESAVIGDIIIDLEEAGRLGRWLMDRRSVKAMEDLAAETQKLNKGT